MKFHKEHLSTQQCKFCNNPLTLERIVWIENNIKDDSGEKEKIEEELKDLLDNFENYKLELKKYCKILNMKIFILIIKIVLLP